MRGTLIVALVVLLAVSLAFGIAATVEAETTPAPPTPTADEIVERAAGQTGGHGIDADPRSPDVGQLGVQVANGSVECDTTKPAPRYGAQAGQVGASGAPELLGPCGEEVHAG